MNKRYEEKLAPILKWGDPFPYEQAEELSEGEFWYAWGMWAETTDTPPVYLQLHDPELQTAFIWPDGDGNWLVSGPDKREGWEVYPSRLIGWKKMRYFRLYACRHDFEELPQKYNCYHEYRCKKCGHTYAVDTSD